MPPPPRANSVVNWMELLVRTAIILGVGWFLVNRLLNNNPAVVAPRELKAADLALKANDVARARAQFDQLIRESARSPIVYENVIEICGANKQAGVLTDYAHRAEQDCAHASKADQAQLYRALAGAYLDCGEKLNGEALAAARKADSLEPDSMESMNSLAYTLSETSRDPALLKQAQDLIVRALDQLNSRTGVEDRPQISVMFADTYGWVLYKQGLYGAGQEARENLTHAVNVLIDVVDQAPEVLPDTVSSTLYYHLGAAYGSIGRVQDARNMLAVALSYDPTNQPAKLTLEALPSAPGKDSAGIAPAVPASGQPVHTAPSIRAFTPLSAHPGPSTSK